MKKLLLIIASVLLASTALAQTVSPIIAECGKKCRGTFTVSNGNIRPIAVTVEPASFRLNPADGKSIFRPLDATVEVKISETSVRLGPMESHDFDYDITCAAYPCLVALQTGMVVGHTTEGIALRFIVPHIVYMCPKQKDCRATSRVAAGLKD